MPGCLRAQVFRKAAFVYIFGSSDCMSVGLWFRLQVQWPVRLRPRKNTPPR